VPKVAEGTIKLADIVWDPSLYPRERWNSHTIEVYIDALRSGAQFPPLVLEAETNRLLDGVHRQKAYAGYTEAYETRQEAPDTEWDQKSQWASPIVEIPVEWHTVPDGDPPKLYSLWLNTLHGDRVTTAEKKARARETCETNPDYSLEKLALYTGTSRSVCWGFVADILARRQEAKLMLAYRLHRLGWTQEEIGVATNYSQRNVSDTFIAKFPDLEKSVKILLEEGYSQLDVAQRLNMPLMLVWAVDSQRFPEAKRPERVGINLQPYDVWTFPRCHDLFGMEYPGRIPGELIAHVLYFFTELGAVVLDPMAGSGTTVDVCLAMGRRCYAYDLVPFQERPDILPHDLRTGWPERTKKAQLIFWDPPYFAKKADGYAEGSISGLPRQAYLDFFQERLREAHSLVKKGTRLALLMSDWDEEGEAGIFLWDYAALLQQARWRLTRQVQAPLSTQQVHPDLVKKFRAAKRLARLERYLLMAEA
jgi:hypothetical protein